MPIFPFCEMKCSFGVFGVTFMRVGWNGMSAKRRGCSSYYGAEAILIDHPLFHFCRLFALDSRDQVALSSIVESQAM